ncbi:TPA: cell division ATP-binding protein FtsE [bacterium]|nr:cell division ATP-binding protein FtsE [bacterium]
MIQTLHLTKVYGKEVVALVDVNIKIKKGEFVFLVGPSGAGKTTFIRILFLDESPTSGQVIIAGRNVTYLPHNLIPCLRRNIGVVFQDFKLLCTRTVFENVAIALEVRGLSRSEIVQQTMRALFEVGLQKKRDLFPHQISGGEQQRVAIARAMVGRPEIILADEPIGNLDAKVAEEVLDYFKMFNQEGATILFATHNPEIARGSGKRIIYLEEGRIIKEES